MVSDVCKVFEERRSRWQEVYGQPLIFEPPFEFVAPVGLYYLFLALVVFGFLITVEAVKRLFYARLAGQTKAVAATAKY